MKVIFHATVTAMLGCLLVMLLMSCDSRHTYIGTYQTSDDDAGPCEPTVIDLRENGEGAWKCDNEEVAFTWYVKDGEIRIHTREGGVMTCVLTANGFDVMLPNETELRFEKISPDNK